ncbi:MAG: hypothetical protein ACREHD_20350, partial [Pirellulales bacterium]
YNDQLGKDATFAYFPLFPLLGRAVAQTTGASSGISLLTAAYVSLGAMFVAFKFYMKARFPAEPEENHDFALLAFGLWPATFFFRMAYSEPLFVCLAILVLLSIEQRRSIWLTALIGGLASATRPVGIAVALPIAMAAWNMGGGWISRASRTGSAALLACSGLIGYMAYQYNVCGDVLRFAHVQSYWHVRPAIPPLERAGALAWFEPLIDLYRPSSAIYYGMLEDHRTLLLSFLAANGPLFVAVVAGIGVGVYRGWLTRSELALSAGLLLIPYLTRSYEMGMSGMGRFATVAFPFYVVAGRVLCGLPRATAGALLGIAGVFLMIYSSLIFAGFTLR